MMLSIKATTRQRRLLVLGLWLRAIGSISYLQAMGGYYGGGDYKGYFREGLQYSQLLSFGQYGAALEPWFEAGWWGTSATSRIAGFVLFVIGPSLEGAFLVFAILGYFGLVCIWLAYDRSFPHGNSTLFLAWIVLFPSLWFWPTSLGKDALVLFGIGLFTMGFSGRSGTKNWIPMLLGVATVFAIRPQVAAVLVFAAGAGQWLSITRRGGTRSVFQGITVLCLGLLTLALAGGALGIEMFNPDEVEHYLVTSAQLSSTGGSSLDVDQSDGLPKLMAPVNTLLRPFLWEAKSPTALVAALEVLLMWLLIVWNRQRLRSFVRQHRNIPLFWMAIGFSVVYAVALGMSVSNLGIIARQRIHILPFVFMLITGTSTSVRSRRKSQLQNRRYVPREILGSTQSLHK